MNEKDVFVALMRHTMHMADEFLDKFPAENFAGNRAELMKKWVEFQSERLSDQLEKMRAAEKAQ